MKIKPSKKRYKLKKDVMARIGASEKKVEKGSKVVCEDVLTYFNPPMYAFRTVQGSNTFFVDCDELQNTIAEA